MTDEQGTTSERAAERSAERLAARQDFLRRRAEEQARMAMWRARWAALLAKKRVVPCCVNTPHHGDGEPRPCPNRA